jgi:uncharacterized damage-inducible protein DinB
MIWSGEIVRLTTASFLLCFVAFALSSSANAQTGLVETLVKHWETSKALTIAVAEAMPADQYSFKATDAEMSFGGQMNHIASANGFYCSVGSGQPSPVPQKSEDTKDTAIKNLNTAFDFCIDQVKKMSNADPMKMVGKAPRQMTAFEAFWGAFTHTAHHRGQAEVYLRLKGIKPPDYKF